MQKEKIVSQSPGQISVDVPDCRWLPRVLLIMVLTLLLTPVVQATASEETPEDRDVEAAAPARTESFQADDGGRWELGIHGSAANLAQATEAERHGMRYWLAPLSNWVVNYDFNETTAWEEDFKRMSLGGMNNAYADAVDLQFYVGNGSPYGFTFANAGHDDASLGYDDCEGAWGDNDNEWVALTSANVLDDSKVHEWAQCFNGSRLILGFNAAAYTSSNYWEAQSYWFGYYVRQNYSMAQAWFKACDLSQHSLSVTRVLANELDCFDDHPNLGQACADSFDTDWWYWSHSCDVETATSTPSARLTQGMPVFSVAPYGLPEPTPVGLLHVFSIPVTATVQDGIFLTARDKGREVEADRGSTHFAYYDLNNLWSAAAAEAASTVNADSPSYISDDEARQIADDFLNRTGLMAPGSLFSEVISDSISVALDSAPGAPPEAIGASATADAVNPTAWQVIYSRRLVYTPTVSATGLFTEPIEFALVGPGAKQKVYVAVDPATMVESPLDDPILGVLGGWREVQPQLVVNAAGMPEAVTVSLLPTDTVRALYDALGERVAMADIPLDFKRREILSETVAYYEMAPGLSQAQLIPVYQLLVRFTLQDDSRVEEYVHVPVNELYMRPYAAIIAGIPNASVRAGTTLTLTAADASQTLQALGIGDFNFALGNGVYIYNWYIDSLDDSNRVASGRTVTFAVPVGNAGHGSTRTILLQVVDLNSPNPSSSTASITIAVDPAIFLPLVNGN